MGRPLGFRSPFGDWPSPIKVETRLSSCRSLPQFTMAPLFCIRALLVAWTTQLGRVPHILYYGSEGLPEPEPVQDGVLSRLKLLVAQRSRLDLLPLAFGPTTICFLVCVARAWRFSCFPFLVCLCFLNSLFLPLCVWRGLAKVFLLSFSDRGLHTQ